MRQKLFGRFERETNFFVNDMILID